MAQSDWECFYLSRVRDPSPLHAYLRQFTDAYYIKKKIITRVTHLTGAFIEMEVVIQGVMVFLTVMLLFSPQCRFYDIPQVLIQSL